MLTIVERKREASVVVLGAGGFLGTAVIDAGVDAGVAPIGVVRQPRAAERIERGGGIAVLGDAAHPESWISEAANAVAVIDLVQPRIPRRSATGPSRKLSQSVWPRHEPSSQH